MDRLHAAFVEFAATREVKDQLSSIGAEPATLTPAEFGAMIKSDLARWRKVAAEAGVRL